MVGKPRHESRGQCQQFLDRLAGRDLAEQQRIGKEHTAYIAGTRDTDADFGEAPPPPLPNTRRAPDGQQRKPTTGKDAAPEEEDVDDLGNESEEEETVPTRTKKKAVPKMKPILYNMKQIQPVLSQITQHVQMRTVLYNLINIRHVRWSQIQHAPAMPVTLIWMDYSHVHLVNAPRDDHHQPVAPGFEVLDSDCDDTGSETCFYDDEEELLRARQVGRTADDGQTLDAGIGDPNASSEDTGNESEDDGSAKEGSTTNTVAQASSAGVAREWRELDRSEMVNFAKDNDAMADMRASGWSYGTCIVVSIDDVTYNIN
ncbi:hypothetical protein PI125_g22549 [Phytophthora idaei]|nr:hypothetical protein PI125_g22549 [Phytophthora idaei]